MKKPSGWLRKTADMAAYQKAWRAANPKKCAFYESKRIKVERKPRAPTMAPEEKRKHKNRLARERKKRWLKAHPDIRKAKKCARNGRRRATSKDGSFTSRDITALLEAQGTLCNHCSTDIKTTYTVDHIRAISRGGSNKRENIQLLCAPCNTKKGNS